MQDIQRQLLFNGDSFQDDEPIIDQPDEELQANDIIKTSSFAPNFNRVKPMFYQVKQQSQFSSENEKPTIIFNSLDQPADEIIEFHSDFKTDILSQNFMNLESKRVSLFNEKPSRPAKSITKKSRFDNGTCKVDRLISTIATSRATSNSKHKKNARSQYSLSSSFNLTKTMDQKLRKVNSRSPSPEKNLQVLMTDYYGQEIDLKVREKKLLVEKIKDQKQRKLRIKEDILRAKRQLQLYEKEKGMVEDKGQMLQTQIKNMENQIRIVFEQTQKVGQMYLQEYKKQESEIRNQKETNQDTGNKNLFDKKLHQEQKSKLVEDIHLLNEVIEESSSLSKDLSAEIKLKLKEETTLKQDLRKSQQNLDLKIRKDDIDNFMAQPVNPKKSHSRRQSFRLFFKADK